MKKFDIEQFQQTFEVIKKLEPKFAVIWEIKVLVYKQHKEDDKALNN